MRHLQQQHYHLINVMAYQQPIGTVVQLLTNVSEEVVIAISIRNALDAWFVAPTIAAMIFRHQEAPGLVVLTAVKV